MAAPMPVCHDWLAICCSGSGFECWEGNVGMEAMEAVG